jgi:TolA-binding protein
MLAKRAILIRAAFFMALAILLSASSFSATAGQDPSGRPADPGKGKKPPVKKPPVNTAPQPITVILTILTEPPESEVYINGEQRGTTNAEGKAQFEKLALGQYSIEVRKQGFTSQLRGFRAGADSPTLVFKLEVSLEEDVKRFDSLISEGKLTGPESPNALEVAEALAVKYPTRPEVARMRGVLGAKLVEVSAPVAERTVTEWRTITRDEIRKALDQTEAALALKADDKRLRAQASLLKGVLALRDGLQGIVTAQAEAGKQGGESPPESGLPTARAELEKAVALDDTWAAARYHLGVALFNSGDLAGAQAAFVKVGVQEPRWVFAHINLGSAFYAAGKYVEAIEAYRKALLVDANNAAALSGLGLARTMKGEKDGLKDLERAIQLNPESAPAHLNIGIALSKSKKAKDIQRAVEEVKKAIQLNPNNLDFQNQVAQQILGELEKRKK